MSTDIYSKLFLGIRATQDDFFKVVGKTVLCTNKHSPTDPSQNFCSKCGQPFKESNILEPTPLLQLLSPEGSLSTLTFNDKRLRFQSVLQVTDGCSSTVCALGFYLLETESHRSAGDTCCSMTMDDLQGRLEGPLQEIAQFMDRPVELFLSTYF